LAHELRRNGIPFQLQYPQPLKYKDIRLDCGYRIDILVENKLILELKSVEEIKGIHEAQLLTYMKLAGVKIGLLINFNNTKLKDGIQRFVL
jgi:GxxExxY protein